jgi:EVE domain
MDWLKMLGTTEKKMKDAWLEEREVEFFTSRKRMNMRPGDRVAYYATGLGSVFAIGTVKSFPYEHPDGNGEGFDWRINVELDRYREFIHEGTALELIDAGGRDLRKSIRRQSHIKLRPDEFEAISTALAA